MLVALERRKLSEPSLVGGCTRSRGVRTISAESLTGHTGTIGHNEGTMSFQVPEVQQLLEGTLMTPMRLTVQQRYRVRLK